MTLQEDAATLNAAIEQAVKVYHTFCQPKKVDLTGAEQAGMIARGKLVNGMMYAGFCRNATTAVWHAAKDRFVILRTKFGNTFPEDVPHPADDDGYDVFVPTLEMGT